MKVDFEYLERVVAAGATGAVILMMWREHEAKKEPRREADKMRKRAEKSVTVRNDAESERKAVETDFDKFWKTYPKRMGANPRAPAEKLFVAAVRCGTDPAAIIEGARQCAITDAAKIGTQYIPQTVKWLRDKRWQDYSATAQPAADVDWDQLLTTYKQTGHWSRWAGPGLDSPACRVPPEMLAKYDLAVTA